ncbi:PIN domain-containing protein [Halorussus salilacus]|uniref:type II toxin-antitoxin system VapC family toxin n=1 Tax=Halorussus salilacus TaxID=2953750 RepID=UPI00209FF128|nr:PIN domain-containing protein [Halorussus salilacus]USZ66820.1 PIN domain-containing protein [Halorussus salilacus]
MSLFIDTGVFYAQSDRDAHRHPTANEALESVLSSEYGRLYTSDYVFAETVTLTRKRTGRFEYANRIGDRILGKGDFPHVIETITTSEELFQRSIETFERYDDHDLSFTDASTVALVRSLDIDAVLAFDDDFDGLVSRLDPREVAS